MNKLLLAAALVLPLSAQAQMLDHFFTDSPDIDFSGDFSDSGNPFTGSINWGSLTIPPGSLDASAIDPATVTAILADAIASMISDDALNAGAIDPATVDAALADAIAAAISSGALDASAIDAGTVTTVLADAILAASTDGGENPSNELGGLTIAPNGSITYSPTGNASAGPVDMATQSELDAATGVSSDANNSLSLGGDGLPFFDHVASNLVYNDDNTCTHTDGEGGSTTVPCLFLLAKDNTFYNDLPFGEAINVSVLENDVVPTGTAQAIVGGSENDVSVSINGDGSHAITIAPTACAAGGWSYDYELTGPNGQVETATVSGVVDNTPVTLWSASTDNAAGEENNISLFLANGGTYDVHWGDGNVSNNVPSSNIFNSASNIYASAYSGPVDIIGSACEEIEAFRSNIGHWDFNIADLPFGLTYYANYGSNTTTGDIADLPSGLTLYASTGFNTTTGDIADLPAGLTLYSNTGSNTTTGDIADLPFGLTYYANYGSNTTTGDIADLPAGVTYYANAGSNTTTGDIADLPAGLTYYSNTGSNTTTGDIANLPTGLTYYANTGLNTVGAISTTWPAVTAGFRLFIQHGAANTQTEVDNMLVALTNVTSWANEKNVDVSNANAAPSATGVAACGTIIANGATACITN